MKPTSKICIALIVLVGVAFAQSHQDNQYVQRTVPSTTAADSPSKTGSLYDIDNPDDYFDQGAVDSDFLAAPALWEAGEGTKGSRAATDRNWVSLPYHCDYDSVSELVADLSPAGDPLTVITRLDDTLQQYESYIWLGFMWAGTDFTIEPGRAYEMVTTADTFLVLVGSNDPDGLINLTENPTRTSRNWVSIPYNAVYQTVSDITTEYAPAGDPLTIITRLDDTLQQYESYIWLGFMWAGTDFAIEPGYGYEMVTITDTTWNPTEYSNEAAEAMIARRGAAPVTAEVVIGNAAETDRAPAFAVTQDVGVGLSAAPAVVHNTGKDIRPSPSHPIITPVELGECRDIVFTAYRPDAPHDVLTEEMIGSGVVYTDGLGYVWFNAGNFDTPWQPGEEVILIIEATKDGRGYFTVLSIELDETVDMQNLETVSLTAIPEPVIASHAARWSKLDSDYIIGYSLYQNDERINNEMITAADYAVAGEVSLKLVFTGGYETVSGSQGFEDARPRTFAFSIRPNPFAERATISYALPRAQDVSIKVYDVTGRQVTTLASGAHEPGFFEVTWAGDDAVGRQAATGVYFVKILTDEYQSQHKVILVR